MPKYLEEPDENEPRYTSKEDYDNKLQTKRELGKMWAARIEAADRVYTAWAERFKVEMLYQYYEGFQWFFEVDENNRPYVINMIWSTIESKLPSLIFDNPQFGLTARPVGLEFDEDIANESAQRKEDALNFICARPGFGISDKHELAVLDAFFGFGIMEVDYSEDLICNPYIPISGQVDPLDKIYCKQIPFDTFRCSSTANWDLSNGKWYGYFEFIPHNRLQKYASQLNFEPRPYGAEDSDFAQNTMADGKIQVATDSNKILAPANTCKIWKLWDFETGKMCIYAPDECMSDGDCILEYTDFKYSPLSFLRFGKRRKGWYPYPPIWNWISPQDEINDTRQSQRLHRKRFSRKYLAMSNAFESEEEMDKFLYGPDGTVIKVNNLDAVKPVIDAPMDPVAPQTIGLTYDDFNRISQTPDEQRGIPVSSNRTTATQANIMNQQSQIKLAKDSLRVGDFLCSIARCTLKALREVKKEFWIKAKLPQIDGGPMKELKPTQYKWKKIPPQVLKDADDDVDLTVTSVSPIDQQKEKNLFLEFLAVITQYEILSFSPELLKEAAYRIGYKNERVLNQFQQMAQLAAIGRLAQLKGAAQPQGPQPTQPGQLPQQQIDQSTPPDGQSIMNAIFNRQPTQ